MFDPYRKWLGIPEQFRPPTHYQLLGIGADEQDRDVIEAAAIRQSAYVRNFQNGPNGDEAARLLNEIAAARGCLLDAAKRAAYDATIRPAATAAVHVPPGSLPRAVAVPVTSVLTAPASHTAPRAPLADPAKSAAPLAPLPPAAKSGVQSVAARSSVQPGSRAQPDNFEAAPSAAGSTAGKSRLAVPVSTAPRAPAQPSMLPDARTLAGAPAATDALLDELVAAQIAAPALRPRSSRFTLPRVVVTIIVALGALLGLIAIVEGLHWLFAQPAPKTAAVEPSPLPAQPAPVAKRKSEPKVSSPSSLTPAPIGPLTPPQPLLPAPQPQTDDASAAETSP